MKRIKTELIKVNWVKVEWKSKMVFSTTIVQNAICLRLPNFQGNVPWEAFMFGQKFTNSKNLFQKGWINLPISFLLYCSCHCRIILSMAGTYFYFIDDTPIGAKKALTMRSNIRLFGNKVSFLFLANMKSFTLLDLV